MRHIPAGIVVATLTLIILFGIGAGATNADELKSPLAPSEAIHMTYLPVPRKTPAAEVHHAAAPAVQVAVPIVARDGSDAGLSREGRR